MSSGVLTAIPVGCKQSTNVLVPHFQEAVGKEVRSWEYSLYQIILKTPLCVALLPSQPWVKKKNIYSKEHE